MVAENAKILTAEQEAKLLQPIDETVGAIQAKINDLRAEGTDKVVEVQSILDNLKRDKVYTAQEKATRTKELQEQLAKAVLRETATNGLRARRWNKYFLTPGRETVETPFGPIRIKTAQGWDIAHRKPEYDDVAAAAHRAGVPFAQVWEAALIAAKKEESSHE